MFITQKQHLEFFEQNKHLKTKELSIIFNKTFGTNLIPNQLSKIRYKNYKHFKWPEQDDNYITFLKENGPKYNLSKLTEIFNKTFNTNYTRKVLIQKCEKHNIIIKSRAHPIGTILPTTSKNGVTKYSIKTSSSGNYRKDWEELSRYYYKLYYGNIPKDHVIIFLDGNHLNTNKENLYAIHRKILGSLRAYAMNYNIEIMNNNIFTKAFCELLKTELLLKERIKYD